jgi:hypothetical protein
MIFLFQGCHNQSVIGSRPPDHQLVWVSIFYSGGKQCNRADSYQPPEIKQVLNQSHIRVFDVKIEVQSVCEGCGCPQYAATHYALIDKAYLSKANSLGFVQNNPPNYLE